MYILLGVGELDMGFHIQNTLLGNLSPMCNDRSRKVISSVENAWVYVIDALKVLFQALFHVVPYKKYIIIFFVFVWGRGCFR